MPTGHKYGIAQTTRNDSRLLCHNQYIYVTSYKLRVVTTNHHVTSNT